MVQPHALWMVPAQAWGAVAGGTAPRSWGAAQSSVTHWQLQKVTSMVEAIEGELCLWGYYFLCSTIFLRKLTAEQQRSSLKISLSGQLFSNYYLRYRNSKAFNNKFYKIVCNLYTWAMIIKQHNGF